MKMKNNRGLVLIELLTIIAFVAVIIAFVAYIALKDGNKRKYEVFATYRDEKIKYYKEIYLEDIVNDNYIKPFKNPFRGGGNCDLY